MKTYRIKIEHMKGFKHVKQFTIDTDSIDNVIEKLELVLQQEIQDALHRFNLRCTNYFDTMSTDAKGSDISEKEFLDNERFFETL
jgi:succinate dehydrogenase/fumarate reductase-like Fe-S protein